MKALEEFEGKLYMFALRAQRGEDLESIKCDYEKAKREFIEKSTIFYKLKALNSLLNVSDQAIPD
jgi:hypothetical protein